MRSVLKYILLFNILFTVLQSEAQYIDTLCINTLGRGYHVFGLPGSTYTWNIPGGTPAPVSVDDTIFVNWGSVPGVYTISVIEHSKDGCDGKLVVGDVRLVNNPYVYAGNNATICADSNVTLSNSDSNYCTSILWTTSGDGLFSNTGILHPVYTPGPADIFAGFVNLTLTGKGLGQTCPNASSVVTITIIKPVIASAGPDVSACAITPYTITGATAANYASLLWTHNGAGTLQNHTTINPTYIPAPGEVGTVTFTLQAFSISPCHQTVIDQMIMTIFPLPTGTFVLLSKDSICGEDTVRLRIDLTGTPPWTFTYTDGTTTTTVTNLFTTPYYITTFPDSSVTYTVTTLSDANCTTFPGTQNTVSVLVHPKPPVEYTWQIGPQNYEVQFHIDSSIVDLGAVGYMVVWNFGDGTFGYGHNPIHFYPGSTTFHCILTITDTNGCSNSVMHEIFVPPVQIAFYSSNSPTCLGTPMCFQDLSTVPNPPATYIQTWIWNFGDGTPPDTIHFPNNPNVCHTYAVIGTYPVTLTIRDNWGTTSSYVHDQIVIPDPIAVFTYTSNCEHQPVQFTDATQLNGGGIIMSWNWDFDDPTSGINNTSILQNPIHSFTGGNTFYNVRLIIQNFNGCRDTLVRPVYILQKPPVEFTRDSACNGQVVHYVADAGIMHVDSIVTWSWDFGDGSQPSTNPVTATHTFTAPGTYITTLTVTDIHGCFNSVSHGVKVNPLPIPVFSWSSPVCSGSPVHFTDNSTVPLGYTGYIAKWFWEFGDGTSQLITLPGSPNVTHTFIGTASTHNVRLTVWTNDSCSQFVEHVVQTIPAPIADFNSSNVRCENQPVQFTDISQTNGGGSINQWSWNFDDPGSGINNTSGLQNPLHTYVNSGTYMVSLIVTNATGCTDTIVKAVDVKVAPVANFRADTACLHSVTQFTDLSVPNGANIISYSWDFGDGTAPAHMQNPTHIYAISGIFNVKLSIVNSNGCTKDTTKPVLVNPLPNAEFSYSAPNCFGAVVQYTNLSTTPPGYLGSIVKWVWDFGDGTSNTILAPNNPDVSHTFAGTALSHVVRLTVTTSDGCMSFVEHTINSIPSPVADFGFPGINCATQSVQFTDLSHTNNGGPIISWHWNFGDPVSGFSNTSTLQSPVHLFTGPGTYNVTLIVNNASSCSDTISKSITISPSPLANFTADTACLHQPTQFTDNSVPNAASIITYAWDFGDGSPISSLPNPTHTFTSYGVQNVKLTITNSNGCIGEITKQVLVHPLPLPEFTFTTANCHGSSVQFTDASSTVIGYLGSIVQWVWDFGDGTPPVTIVAPGNPNVSHVFAGSANSYVVRLTVTTSDGCSDFKEHTVSTNASPIADFTYPSGSCDQQSIQFTDISQSNGGGTITQWHWDFGDPGSGFFNTSSIQNPGHNFSSPGTYTVTEIIYTESGCSDTTTHSVTVISSPLADFVADTACFGSPTTFTDQSTSPSGIITQYIWHFGDGTTSLQKNPVHTYLTDGIHQVTLRVTTQYGCTKEITKPVLVVPRPVATFSATTPVCLGSLVYFTDNSVSLFGTIQTWSWDFGDGTIVNINAPLSPNVNHLYQIAGTYTVVLRITTSHGCIATTSNPVVIQPAPIANFAFSTARCENSPVQFTDMSNPNGGSPVTQWLWNFNDPASGSSNSSNIQNPVHLFTGTGTYNVSLTVTTSNGCTNTNPLHNSHPTRHALATQRILLIILSRMLRLSCPGIGTSAIRHREPIIPLL
jgi:PKD repeat protein